MIILRLQNHHHIHRHHPQHFKLSWTMHLVFRKHLQTSSFGIS